MTSRAKKDLLICIALLGSLGSGVMYGFNLGQIEAKSRIACEVTR